MVSRTARSRTPANVAGSGVLSRVAGLFSGRGYNIESLCVAPTQDPTVSQMTIVTTGDDAIIEQVCKQLHKLIDVIKVYDLGAAPRVERDLLLAKVNAPAQRRAEIFQIVEVFRAKVVDVGQKELVVELTGDEEKIQAFIELMRPFGIREMARTGLVAMARSQAKGRKGEGK